MAVASTFVAAGEKSRTESIAKLEKYDIGTEEKRGYCLIFSESKVYCIQIRSGWRQLLTGLGIGRTMALFQLF